MTQACRQAVVADGLTYGRRRRDQGRTAPLTGRVLVAQGTGVACCRVYQANAVEESGGRRQPDGPEWSGDRGERGDHRRRLDCRRDRLREGPRLRRIGPHGRQQRSQPCPVGDSCCVGAEFVPVGNRSAQRGRSAGYATMARVPMRQRCRCARRV